MKRIKEKSRNKLVVGGESHDLFIAGSGETKSFAIERLAEEYFKKGYTIIHLSNAKNNLEQAFCLFKPKAKYHLNKLEFQDEEPETHEIKRYIPFSNNFPIKKIYQSEIFSLDIKNLDRVNISFLFENSGESSSISVLNQAISNLKKDEGIFDLIYKLKSGNIKIKQDIFSVETEASSINLKTILNYFGRFRNNPILMPSEFEYNLNMKKILNDNSIYHIFDLQYLPDQKLKDFVQLYILNEILKVKSTGQTDKEIVVIIDELKILANANPLFDHQKVLNKLLTNILSIARSMGIKIVSASQTYHDIDQAVRQSFTNIILGRTSAFQDIMAISQITGMSVYDRQAIFSLRKNQFILLSQDVGEGIYRIYTFHAPRHKHCERNEHFDVFAQKYYPERLRKHTEFLKKFTDYYKEQEKRVRKLMYEKNEKQDNYEKDIHNINKKNGKK
jgi:hypothetical protein